MTVSTNVEVSLRQMIAALDSERQALAALDLDALSMASNTKLALCEDVGMLSADGLNDECLGLIRAAKQKNEVNRQIRNLLAANVAARLDALTGRPGLYQSPAARRA